MQVNPEDDPPEIYVTWSDPWMTDFENQHPKMAAISAHFVATIYNTNICDRCTILEVSLDE